MSREEFIAGYCDRSGIAPERRTATGFRIGERERVAVPCACEEEGCEGWAMVAAAEATEYAAFYGPKP